MKAVLSTTAPPQAVAFDHELWQRINSINLTLIEDRMLIKYNWTQERFDRAADEYRQYLYLTQIAGTPISPTTDTDEVWHQHILFTAKYAIDCKKMFGKFLHHFPTPAKWKQAQKEKSNCQSPCCNHQDCCNDNPSRTVVKENGVLAHADCGDPAPGGCAPIGGSDDYCSGTTSDSFTNKIVIDFDNPNMDTIGEGVPFKEIVGRYFN